MDEIPPVPSEPDEDEDVVPDPTVAATETPPVPSEDGSPGWQKADTMLTRYGPTLYSLAYAFTEDRGRSEQLVLQAIFTRHVGRPPREQGDSRDVLRDFARMIYLNWSADVETRSLPPHPCAALGQPGESAELTGLKKMPHEHREALALCTFGGHSYRQAADLLKLSPACVAELLLEAPRDLGMTVT
jgi:DNA-directed RNA polymerase specialized sigma24 family protein